MDRPGGLGSAGQPVAYLVNAHHHDALARTGQDAPCDRVKRRTVRRIIDFEIRAGKHFCHPGSIAPPCGKCGAVTLIKDQMRAAVHCIEPVGHIEIMGRRESRRSLEGRDQVKEQDAARVAEIDRSSGPCRGHGGQGLPPDAKGRRDH